MSNLLKNSGASEHGGDKNPQLCFNAVLYFSLHQEEELNRRKRLTEQTLESFYKEEPSVKNVLVSMIVIQYMHFPFPAREVPFSRSHESACTTVHKTEAAGKLVHAKGAGSGTLKAVCESVGSQEKFADQVMLLLLLLSHLYRIRLCATSDGSPLTPPS